ncbi:hypothetical protein [Xenophilus azovorans]|uniref:hypothetical protein n=1 Tax=Xenophilus azovorans TaxID=151755 RepID=UPI0012EE2119|nr:hypothetical protein [Xenophilus azovorans]
MEKPSRGAGLRTIGLLNPSALGLAANERIGGLERSFWAGNELAWGLDAPERDQGLPGPVFIGESTFADPAAAPGSSGGWLGGEVGRLLISIQN